MKYSIKILTVFLFVICFSVISNGQEEKDKNQSPLKFTYRPKPNYTDSARRNQVEGNVKLKVTFLANGKIGEVVDITEENNKELRETGLINQAIKAAKKIRFNPEIENGNPVTVIRTVIFNFTIY